MQGLIQDVRHALRLLRKSAGVTGIAVIALALGIGVNATMYSTVQATLLHPFAFPGLHRIMTVWEKAPKQNIYRASVAPANFRDWAQRQTVFQEVAAGHGWTVNLTGTGDPERLDGYQVTEQFFPLLGMKPLLGRTFTGDEMTPGKDREAVVSYSLWQAKLGGDPQAVGRTVMLDGQAYTVIGVMPEDFEFPMACDVWAPLALTPQQAGDRQSHYLRVLGRLKPGVSISQAEAAMNTLQAQVAAQNPGESGHGVHLEDLVTNLAGGMKQFVLVLMAAAGFVLLLACANVANLQLARATGRQRELAVRRALGASRWRIARQLLVEAVLLGGAGGVLGVFVAMWAVDITERNIPAYVLRYVIGLRHIRVDGGVLAFTVATALLAGMISGVAPALMFSRPLAGDGLNEGTRSTHRGGRMRSVLVMGELALALVLLISAALMVEGFHAMADADQGYDPRHVLTMHLSLPEEYYRQDAQRRDFYQQLTTAAAGLPGVQAAALSTSLPGPGGGWNSYFVFLEGAPPPRREDMKTVLSSTVSPGYAAALRIPLLRGRWIGEQDGPDAPQVMVVSKFMAEQFWPGQDPIGRRARLGRDPKTPYRTVVGVVGDVRETTFETVMSPVAYVPTSQLPPEKTVAMVVRTAGDPLAVAAPLRDVVHRLDPALPVYDIRTLEDAISDNVSGVRISSQWMTVFALLALLLAAAGTYAVMSYSVEQRTHEIGVRMALGAEASQVLRLILAGVLRLSLVGLGVGLVLAAAFSRVLKSLLVHVQLAPAGFVGLAILMAAVALLAGYLPARRAAKVDPMVALRYE